MAANSAGAPAVVAELSALDLTLRALRPWLAHPDVSEVCINRPREIFVETPRGWSRAEAPFADFDWCRRLAKLVANVTRQRVDETTPLLSAALPSGERVQIVLPPATTLGCVAITIRRPADVVWPIEALAERGAFAGIHAAMMVHPAPVEMIEAHLIAASMFDVHYTGKEAHASAFPELGINAADALTVAQTSIGLLRQHLRPTDRVHGFTTHGGEAPNVIPAHTSARYIVRAENIEELKDVRTKVYRCFEAGAIATGSKLEIRGGDKPYADVRYDHEISQVYKRNAEAVGRVFAPLSPMMARLAASTDMGNVSQVIPSIHPMIGINSLPAANHQPEFTAHCITETADQAVLDGSLAMAWTAIDLAQQPALRERLARANS